MSYLPGRSRLDSDRKPEIDLAQVLEHYGSMVSPGRQGNQITSCPLHEDRTPSCSVHLTKGVWHCHSCDQGGDGLTLIALKEGVDRNGARELAAGIGIKTARHGRSTGSLRGSSYARGGRLPDSSGAQDGDGSWRPSWSRH